VSTSQDKLKSALDILRELESKPISAEVKVRTKEIEVILVDYREQLRRYDTFALNFDFILYFNKNAESYAEKLAKIIEALERMRPVRAKLLVKVDYVPANATELIESVTGDVIDIIDFQVIEDVLKAPIFSDRGTVSLSRAGNAKIRTDGTVYVISDATRNGERIKVLAQKGNVEVLFSYAKLRSSGGYAIAEGIYFIPLEDLRKILTEDVGVREPEQATAETLHRAQPQDQVATQRAQEATEEVADGSGQLPDRLVLKLRSSQ